MPEALAKAPNNDESQATTLLRQDGPTNVRS